MRNLLVVAIIIAVQTVKIFWSFALSGGILRPKMALRECKRSFACPY